MRLALAHLLQLGRQPPEPLVLVPGERFLEPVSAIVLHETEEVVELVHDVMAPLLASGDVEFIGEINDAEKPAFLSGARALLFPITWPEPFGLVMIEAMACGCPVIATPMGSVPEVIEDGRTGFIVENEDAAVAAIARLPELSRPAIRTRFEQRWTAGRMAEAYVDVYKSL